jgi:RNA polymerase sigma-70 factor (ECF subfamily)
LVRPEVGHALALARRMGASDADAEDALQDTLVALSNETSDEPVDVGLRAWICRRVVLRVRMNARASSRRRRHERAVRIRTEAPDPALAPEVRDEVERALNLLSGEQRHVVLLRFLHDLDYREIAYVLGVSENACRLRVHKAMNALRGSLSGKAPALIAALGVPVATAKAATVPAAITVAAASSVVAIAATVTVVMMPEDEAPAEPTPRVAAVEPSEPPEPPPRVGPDGLALLHDHFAGNTDVRPRLKRFDELVSFVDPGGERIELGPGVHHIGPREGRRMLRGSVTYVGAGVDKTTLVATKFAIVCVTGRARGVVFRDLTFEGGLPGRERFGGELLDVRGEAVALFERVRFRHWVAFAGYGAPVGVAGRALLLFRDCEFVGGYHRRHGGNALSVRGNTALGAREHAGGVRALQFLRPVGRHLAALGRRSAVPAIGGVPDRLHADRGSGLPAAYDRTRVHDHGR